MGFKKIDIVVLNKLIKEIDDIATKNKGKKSENLFQIRLVLSVFYLDEYRTLFTRFVDCFRPGNRTKCRLKRLNAYIDEEKTRQLPMDLNLLSDVQYFSRHLPKYHREIKNILDRLESMCGMFYNDRSFNQPLNIWGVSNITNMDYMFRGASSSNQDISGWRVTNITTKPTILILIRPTGLKKVGYPFG